MPFTPEQLIERQSFLGGSEAAPALGMSNWFSPLDLYRSKNGEGEPIEETIPILVGMALEETILKLFERENDLGLTISDRQKLVVDPKWAVRRALLDAVASDGGNVEAKASGLWGEWGKKEDEVPQYIIYQTQHQMACSGATHTWVPVILAQREFRIYRIDRNEELIELLTAGEREFWDYVLTKTPPPPRTPEDIKFLYPVDVGTSIIATADIEALAYACADTKEKRKTLEKLEETQTLGLKEYMKLNAILTDSKGDALFTHKANTEKRMDVTAFRKDHPALAAQYSPEKTVRKLLSKL